MAAHSGAASAKLERTKFFACSCFWKKNFFLKEIGHIDYEGRISFLAKYKQILEDKHFGKEEIENVVSKLEAEYSRRLNLEEEHQQRLDLIKKSYQHIHPDLLELQDALLDPEFVKITTRARDSEISTRTQLDMLDNQRGARKRIYAVPVLTKEFCDLLVEEICNFEATELPKGRPNTMNTYGVLLDELGFDECFLTPLRERYLNPLCRLLFPDWGGGSLDSHKAFVVKYKLGEDVHLDYHYDNAEVTLNVCLGKDFEEGSLFFGGMKGQPQNEADMTEHMHEVTRGLLHRGRHMHGALPIQDGERYNLIIWMRSSKVRNTCCPMCDSVPELVPVKSGFGDGFTKETVNVCNML